MSAKLELTPVEDKDYPVPPLKLSKHRELRTHFKQIQKRKGITNPHILHEKQCAHVGSSTSKDASAGALLGAQYLSTMQDHGLVGMELPVEIRGPGSYWDILRQRGVFIPDKMIGPEFFWPYIPDFSWHDGYQDKPRSSWIIGEVVNLVPKKTEDRMKLERRLSRKVEILGLAGVEFWIAFPSSKVRRYLESIGVLSPENKHVVPYRFDPKGYEKVLAGKGEAERYFKRYVA